MWDQKQRTFVLDDEELAELSDDLAKVNDVTGYNEKFNGSYALAIGQFLNLATLFLIETRRIRYSLETLDSAVQGIELVVPESDHRR